jgi:hypothetical protein
MDMGVGEFRNDIIIGIKSTLKQNPLMFLDFSYMA